LGEGAVDYVATAVRPTQPRLAFGEHERANEAQEEKDMRSINDRRGLAVPRLIDGGEIDSSADPGDRLVDVRDGAGRGEHVAPKSTPEHAKDDASADAEVDGRGNAIADAEGEKPFGGLSPSEAAQRRWSQERAREASAETSGTDAIPTDADIVAALRRKAEKGDTAAARELREWRAIESTAVQGDGWLEVLDARERRIVRRIIERALARARDGSPQPEG
jgi:hypothetical protein